MHVSTSLWTAASAPNTPILHQLSTAPSGTISAPLGCPVTASPLTVSTLTLIPEGDNNDTQTPTAPPTAVHTVTSTTSSHCAQIDSDSSSDFDYPISYTNHHSHIMSFIPNQMATVEHIHQSKSPILLAGEIDPAVMQTFELGCLDFFNCKEIKEEDQVHKILSCFRDTQIPDWISGDHNRLLKLLFADFMTELRANYLDPDWEPMVWHRILAATLKPNQSFWDWFSHMQSLSSLLANTPSHFSDASLQEKLEAGLDPELTCQCNTNKVDKILTL